MRLVAASLLFAASCSPQHSEAQEAVKRLLNDPESAQFREVEDCPSGRGVTGEVNAKNTYGGYVGFKPFFYVDRRVIMVDFEEFTSAMEICYNRSGAQQNRIDPSAQENVTEALDRASSDLNDALEATDGAAANVLQEIDNLQRR